MMRALREAVRRSPVAGPIADLATAIQNPALARRLLADARRTRTEMAFARELPPAKADAPLLLILSMTNDPTSPSRRHASRLPCAAAAGACACSHPRSTRTRGASMPPSAFDDLLAFREARASPPGQRCDRRRGRAAAPEPHGLPLGDGVDLSRRLDRAAAALVGLAQALRGRTRPARSRRRALRSSISSRPRSASCTPPRIRSTVERPDLILVNEPNYHVLGPFVDVAIARGIPTIHFIQPSREDGLIFKRLTRRDAAHPPKLDYARNT